MDESHHNLTQPETAKIGETLLDEAQIRRIITRLAGQLTRAYEAHDRVVVIVLLTGARWFADDLFREIRDDKFQLEFIKASSYTHGTRPGPVTLTGMLRQDIRRRQVLIVDDIYDTGRTLREVARWLENKGAADVRTCVLLEKDRPHEVPLTIDFLGTRIPDTFLIGYGLDYQDRFRTLPFVAALARS